MLTIGEILRPYFRVLQNIQIAMDRIGYESKTSEQIYEYLKISCRKVGLDANLLRSLAAVTDQAANVHKCAKDYFLEGILGDFKWIEHDKFLDSGGILE